MTFSFRLRGFHSLWRAFPNTSSIKISLNAGPTTPRCKHRGLGHVRVRSPLLPESRLICIPAGT
jgi:hypothetical protein